LNTNVFRGKAYKSITKQIRDINKYEQNRIHKALEIINKQKNMWKKIKHKYVPTADRLK